MRFMANVCLYCRFKTCAKEDWKKAAIQQRSKASGEHVKLHCNVLPAASSNGAECSQPAAIYGSWSAEELTDFVGVIILN